MYDSPHMGEPTDEDLAKRAQMRDKHGRGTRDAQEAFSILTVRYQSQLMTYCNCRGDSYQDAEDFAQETLLKAWQALPRKNLDRAFRPWLFTILVNDRKDYYRRTIKKFGRLLSLTPFGVHDPEEQLAEESLRSSGWEERFLQRELTRMVLQKLPEKQRDCLLLYDKFGFSQVEIAQMFGITNKAVSQNIKLAKKKFIALYTRLQAHTVGKEE